MVKGKVRGALLSAVVMVIMSVNALGKENKKNGINDTHIYVGGAIGNVSGKSVDTGDDGEFKNYKLGTLNILFDKITKDNVYVGLEAALGLNEDSASDTYEDEGETWKETDTVGQPFQINLKAGARILNTGFVPYFIVGMVNTTMKSDIETEGIKLNIFKDSQLTPQVGLGVIYKGGYDNESVRYAVYIQYLYNKINMKDEFMDVPLELNYNINKIQVGLLFTF
jgi:hypothetical protein